jgi:hypothetical protein
MLIKVGGDIRIRPSVLPSVVGIPNPFFGIMDIYCYELKRKHIST